MISFPKASPKICNDRPEGLNSLQIPPELEISAKLNRVIDQNYSVIRRWQFGSVGQEPATSDEKQAVLNHVRSALKLPKDTPVELSYYYGRTEITWTTADKKTMCFSRVVNSDGIRKDFYFEKTAPEAKPSEERPPVAPKMKN